MGLQEGLCFLGHLEQHGQEEVAVLEQSLLVEVFIEGLSQARVGGCRVLLVMLILIGVLELQQSLQVFDDVFELRLSRSLP